MDPPFEEGAVNERVAVVESTALAVPIVGAPGAVVPLPTVTEIVAVLEFAVLVAVTVKLVVDSVVVGVPVITPVEADIANPVGSDGEIAHEAAAPPEFVGVIEVMAEPVENEYEAGLMLIFGAYSGVDTVIEIGAVPVLVAFVALTV